MEAMSRSALLYRETAPPPALRRHVAALWHVRGEERRETSTLVLPDGCIDVIYARLPDEKESLFVVGTMRSAERVPLPPGALVVGARFWPGAALPFLRVSASELTGRQVPAGELWRDGRELGDKLHAAGGPAAAHDILVESLLGRLAGAKTEDVAMVRWARELAAAPPGGPAPSPLRLGDRQLRRRFTAAVGIGPKRFARIARFRWLVEQLERPGRPPWADLAAAAGYHDQAHLIREFAELSGETPAAYLRDDLVRFLQ